MLRLSLPSWECGLKFVSPVTLVNWILSLPSWECGLKYNSNKQRDRRSEVTPFVGVWIEITESMTKRRKA